MERNVIRPYALKAGEGSTYSFGPDFIVKAGERGQGRRLAFVEYTTRSGEEPGDHTHPTEDEVFYVLEGAVTFRCGDETFETETGGFIFLPCGLEHGYTIRSRGEVRLLVITSPAGEDTSGGWGGLIGDLEAEAGQASHGARRAMEIEIEVAGEIVERQDLLNGTETVSLEGASEDGVWAISGQLTWNIGLETNGGEGDITFVRDDGAEVFATVIGDEVSTAAPGDDGDAADYTFRVAYEIDGGSGAFTAASGTCEGVGRLAGAGFRGRWTLRLNEP